MHRISYWINRLSNALHEAAKWFLIATGAAMSIIVFLQVFFRFVIYIPFPWSEESARYLMIWVSFLAAALAVQKGFHIGMESLIIRLGPAVRRKVNILTKSAVLIFLLYLTIGGFKISWLVREQSSPALFLSMSYAYAAAGVGGLFMAIQMFHSLIEEWTGPALPGRI